MCEGMMLDRARFIGDASERMGMAARTRWLGAIVGLRSLSQTVFDYEQRITRDLSLVVCRAGTESQLKEHQTLQPRSRSRGAHF